MSDPHRRDAVVVIGAVSGGENSIGGDQHAGAELAASRKERSHVWMAAGDGGGGAKDELSAGGGGNICVIVGSCSSSREG